jgi:AbrB family looped-hinge helix DNA binding protein
MTMRASMDRSGRVVIPKPVRDRLGLEAGGELEVEVAGDAILLHPLPPASGVLHEKKGILVLRCEVEGELDHRLVRAERLSRLGA